MQKGGEAICLFNDFVKQKFDDTEYAVFRPKPDQQLLSGFKNADGGFASKSAEYAYNQLIKNFENQEGKGEYCHEKPKMDSGLMPADF